MTAPRPNAHGGDGHRIAVALGLDPARVLDLSASLNPVAPDPSPVIARHLEAIGRYPDPVEATAALASAMAIPPERLLVTNGGAEAIALVAAHLGRGWADEDDFALYRKHLPVLDRSGPRFRSDPHNPSGALAPAGERAAVWDEAFYPLATGRWTAGRDAITVGSLTKLFACPGLRVGYVVADAGVIADLRARQPQWSVNGLAAAALGDLLDTADLSGWARQIAELRRELVSVLDVAGLDPHPSHANYVLCRRAAGLRDRLAPRGIVVRDCATFGRPGQARIAVPDAGGLARLAEALEVDV